MKELKFQGTPGPWHVNKNYKNQVCADINLPIANVHSLLHPAEIKANARLIAAAPELLEVSQEMASELKRISGLLKGLKNSSLIDKAEAVIKKALEE